MIVSVNRTAMLAEVVAYFADPPTPLVCDRTVDGQHGWIETRCHRVNHDVGWLISERRYPGEIAMLGLAANA